MRETIIISLGGSVIVPSNIDTDFLKELREFILKYLGKYRFVLVIGGGRTARQYQEAAKAIVDAPNDDLDWIGIQATKINAHLVKTIFHDVAYKEILDNPTFKVDFDKVLIACGWKPGWSTDYDAVLLAELYGAKTLINITNVDYLYDKNPNEFEDAKRIERISWGGFQRIVGNEWKPGMNMPFDPVATKKAAELKLKLMLLGKDLDNLKNFLDGKKFNGSLVD